MPLLLLCQDPLSPHPHRCCTERLLFCLDCPSDCPDCGHLCIYNFIMPMHSFWLSTQMTYFCCSLVYTGGISCLQNPQLMGLSKANMQHFSLPYFSKCTPVDIFFASLSSPTSYKKLLKDNNSKNITIITHLVAYLKYEYNYISHLSKHHRALLSNSFRKLKTSRNQHLGP